MKQNRLLNQITIGFLLAVTAKAGTVTLSPAKYSYTVLYNLAGAGNEVISRSGNSPIEQYINAENLALGLIEATFQDAYVTLGATIPLN